MEQAMPRFQILLIAAACAGLGACASQPPPAAKVAADPPPAPEPVDGLYRGTSTRFRADSRKCPHPGLVTLVVQDGQFQYKWAYQTYVDSRIGPGDEVHGQGDGITLLGRRNGKLLEGDVTNGYCSLHFTVRKQEL
jgi:hypothetical protein